MTKATVTTKATVDSDIWQHLLAGHHHGYLLGTDKAEDTGTKPLSVEVQDVTKPIAG